MMPTQPLSSRSFRIVAHEDELSAVQELLTCEGFRFAPEPFSPYCFALLAEPKPLGRSLAAFFGYLYIQDRSSMLPPLALAPKKGTTILDICASPGSKSSFLAQLTGEEGLLLANEPNPTRLQTLRQNLMRLNLPQAITLGLDGTKLPFAQNSLEYIALDPPCSGWGTEKKHPNVRTLWHDAKVLPLKQLQRRLLTVAACMLKPCGYLLYSTCTTNVEENEEQVRFAKEELGLDVVPLQTFDGFVFEEDTQWGLTVNGAASNAQGFFLSLLTKPQSSNNTAQEETMGTLCSDGWIPREALNTPYFDLTHFPKGRFFCSKDKVFFLAENSLTLLPKRLRLQGLYLGTMHAGLFTPQPRLRVGLLKSPENTVVLTEVQELSALIEGQTLQTDLRCKRAALFWRNLPLGSVTIKQGRIVSLFR